MNKRTVFTQEIPSGKTVKITPDLSFVGEGAIYLKYTDSRKETKEVIVCRVYRVGIREL